MADNNYNPSNSLGDNYLPANPYAKKGLLINKFNRIQYCKYNASFQYDISADGLSTTITPLTGNLSADLDFYRVEICADGKIVTESLDLDNRSTPFVIDTSSLNSNVDWLFSFYGEEGRKVSDAGCGLEYQFKVHNVLGATGNSIPADWQNVTFNLKLSSSDDTDFTNLFPVDGVALDNNSVIDLSQYTLSGNLNNGDDYTFFLEVKKVGLSPVAPAVPTFTGSAIDTLDPIGGGFVYPYAITTDLVAMASIILNTTGSGAETSLVTLDLINEGVTPSVSFTINTVVQ